MLNKSLEELEGESLNFLDAIPYKRCLAFHASRARYEAISIHNWMREEDFDIPDDAWSNDIREDKELKSYIELWRKSL